MRAGSADNRYSVCRQCWTGATRHRFIDESQLPVAVARARGRPDEGDPQNLSWSRAVSGAISVAMMVTIDSAMM
jgi:hypothetical protein